MEPASYNEEQRGFLQARELSSMTVVAPDPRGTRSPTMSSRAHDSVMVASSRGIQARTSLTLNHLRLGHTEHQRWRHIIARTSPEPDFAAADPQAHMNAPAYGTTNSRSRALAHEPTSLQHEHTRPEHVHDVLIPNNSTLSMTWWR
jgi:hypothetical protein